MKDSQALADNYDAKTLLTAAGLKLTRDNREDLASKVFDIRTDEILTLYLRREPTTDKLFIKLCKEDGIDAVAAFPKYHEVAYYRDKEATESAGRNTGSSRPTRRNKTVMMNCYRWNVVWLPDFSGDKSK